MSFQFFWCFSDVPSLHYSWLIFFCSKLSLFVPFFVILDLQGPMDPIFLALVEDFLASSIKLALCLPLLILYKITQKNKNSKRSFRYLINPSYPEVFSNQFFPGGEGVIIIPPKINRFNGFAILIIV